MTTSPVMTITAELLAELEQKAKAATPGPWMVETYNQGSPTYQADQASALSYKPAYIRPLNLKASESELGWPDAEHIAAANPATILALVEHIRSLTERLEKADSELKLWYPIHYEIERRAGKTFEWDGCDFQVTIMAEDYAAIVGEAKHG